MSGWCSTGRSLGHSWRALPVRQSGTPQLQSPGSAASHRQVVSCTAFHLLQGCSQCSSVGDHWSDSVELADVDVEAPSITLQVSREEARRQPGSYLRGPATYESGYCLVNRTILPDCQRTDNFPLSHFNCFLAAMPAMPGLALVLQTMTPSRPSDQAKSKGGAC